MNLDRHLTPTRLLSPTLAPAPQPATPPRLWPTLPDRQQQEIILILAGMLHKQLHQHSEEARHD